MTLEGKVALVTGAARGIGAGIAERFAGEGAKVVVNYRSSKEKVDALVSRVEGGSGARAVKADVSGLEEVEALIKQTVETFGRVGQPGDVASAVLFPASEEASWITGEILQVSGGRAM